MSDKAPKGIYVYQPKPPQKDGRIYGIGGLPVGVSCIGWTKDEAEAVADAIKEICWMGDECAECGHRFRFDSSGCPQCGEKVAPPWVPRKTGCDWDGCDCRERKRS